MNDYNLITNLLHLYAEYVDSGDAEGTAALFKNANVKWGINAPVIHGADAIFKLYRENIKIHQDGTPRTHHIITNVIVNIAESGTEATAKSYYTVIQQTNDIPLQVIAGGRYHDQLKKVSKKWEFSRREYFMDFRGNISDHVIS